MQESIFYKQVGERMRKVREEQHMSRERLAELSYFNEVFVRDREGKEGIVLRDIA